MMTLEYWGRVFPVDLKDLAVNEVVEEEMILVQGNASRREHSELNRLWPSACSAHSGLEILRYLAWRVVKERGDDDSLKLEEVLGPS
jgi:hypothetical protein